MTFTTNTVCYFGDASLRLLDFFEETILLLHLHFLVSVFSSSCDTALRFEEMEPIRGFEHDKLPALTLLLFHLLFYWFFITTS